MTLKEIALELLEKYQTSETSCIWELSGNIAESEKWLSAEVQKYRELIEASAELESDCFECKHVGMWKDEIEYGYTSPCTGCKRRANDNYER